jgi:hypothetical protein
MSMAVLLIIGTKKNEDDLLLITQDNRKLFMSVNLNEKLETGSLHIHTSSPLLRSQFPTFSIGSSSPASGFPLAAKLLSFSDLSD